MSTTSRRADCTAGSVRSGAASRAGLVVGLALIAAAWACAPREGSVGSDARERSAGDDGVPELTVSFTDSEDYVFSDEDRRVVEEVAETAIEEVAPLLEGEPSRIELVVQAGSSVIPETGDAGAAQAPGRIGWTVDPGRPGGVLAVARARLRSTLFHEVHHLVRGWTIQGGTAGGRLIDAAAAEGLATAFERDAAGWDPPWGEYPEDEVDRWLGELRDPPEGASYAHWMFQHPDGRRWIGYRAGTYLADRAMAVTGRSAAELAMTPTDELLELSGFDGGGEGRDR